jgi:chromosome segregation ATPase
MKTSPYSLVFFFSFFFFCFLSQLVSCQQELEAVSKEAETLRNQNDSLSSDLRLSSASILQLNVEKDELDEVLTGKASEWMETEGHLSEQVAENIRLNKLLDNAYAETQSYKQQLQTASEGVDGSEQVVRALEEELRAARESALSMQERLQSANVSTVQRSDITVCSAV